MATSIKNVRDSKIAKHTSQIKAAVVALIQFEGIEGMEAILRAVEDGLNAVAMKQMDDGEFADEIMPTLEARDRIGELVNDNW